MTAKRNGTEIILQEEWNVNYLQIANLKFRLRDTGNMALLPVITEALHH